MGVLGGISEKTLISIAYCFGVGTHQVSEVASVTILARKVRDTHKHELTVLDHILKRVNYSTVFKNCLVMVPE